MNKGYKIGIAFLLLTVVSVAFGGKMTDNIWRVGEPGTSDPIKMIFDVNNGATNPELEMSNGVAKFNNATITNTPITGGVISNADIDLGTASNTQRITMAKSTTALLSALTRKEGTMFYDTDQKSVVFDDGTNLRPVGSGSGNGEINYVKNPTFEINNDGVLTYKDTAQATPVDGTGGTALFTTISSETTAPLRGTKSLKIAKTANNAQGEGVAVDFIVDPADLGKKLKVQFDYRTTANYVAGDLGLYLFCDVAGTPTTITPTVTDLPGSSGSNQTFLASFDQSDLGDCRLMFHVKSVSALAYDFIVENLITGPGVAITGAVVSDWQSFTTVLTASGTQPVLGSAASASAVGKWRRVGGNMEVQWDWRWGTTAPGFGTGNYSFALPSGYTVDTSALTTNAAVDAVLGSGYFYDSDLGDFYPLSVAFINSSQNIRAYLSTSLSGQSLTATTPVTMAASDYIGIQFSVPIAEWAGSGTVNLGQNDVTYISDDGTSDVFGPNGALVPNVAASTGDTGRQITLSNKQATNQYVVELNYQGNGWVAASQLWPYSAGNNAATGNRYGVQCYHNSATELTVAFGNQGTQVSSSAVSAGITSWAVQYAAGTRYRLVEAKSGQAVGFGAATAISSGLVSRENSSSEGDIGTILNWASPGSKKYRWNTVGGLTTLTWYISSAGGSASTASSVFWFPFPNDVPPPVNFSNQLDVVAAFSAAGSSMITSNNGTGGNSDFEQMTGLGYSGSVLQVYVRCFASAKVLWTGSVTYRSQ